MAGGYTIFTVSSSVEGRSCRTHGYRRRYIGLMPRPPPLNVLHQQHIQRRRHAITQKHGLSVRVCPDRGQCARANRNRPDIGDRHRRAGRRRSGRHGQRHLGGNRRGAIDGHGWDGQVRRSQRPGVDLRRQFRVVRLQDREDPSRGFRRRRRGGRCEARGRQRQRAGQRDGGARDRQRADAAIPDHDHLAAARRAADADAQPLRPGVARWQRPRCQRR